MPKPPSYQQQSAMMQALQGAVGLHQRGMLGEAEKLYRQVLQSQPQQFDALHLLGVLKLQQQNNAEAVSLISAALRVKGDVVEALCSLGTALANLNRSEEALRNFTKALAIRPADTVALFNRGLALASLNRPSEAIASYQKALAIDPGNVPALYSLGLALRMLDRDAEALASFDKALAIKPDFIEALNTRGLTLHKLGRPEEALASYDRALAINPGYPDALYSRGNILSALKRHAEALATFDKALAVKPAYADALCNRGTLLKLLGRDEEALTSFDRALAINPNLADALYNRGNALKQMQRHDEALASFERAVALNPDHPDAQGAADVVLAMCDWDRVAKDAGALKTEVLAGKSSVTPFTLLGYFDDPSLQLRCAQNYVREKVPARPAPLWNGTRYGHDKIRIAYLSADFFEHATAHLMADIFEQHDRSRFETLAISFSRDDASDMRRRLEKAFDHFHDVRATSDSDVARLMNDLEVDIAVDLKGHTRDSRPEILSFRPAPIQASYLGYPGTMGADFIDYIIADAIVAPFAQQPFYTEKIVHLPGCYQPNASIRRMSEQTPPRAEAGLPDHGFVFCSFNNSYKITRPVFDIWMRLLNAVPGSVLWLLRDNPAAERNLRRTAQERAIDPARLIFADRLPLDQHLARHRLADLFLDTLPVNAHTTASDAVRAGLPVLTCQGESFVARVAASILEAAGLPELVTSSLDDYENLALRLATDATLLASIREKLAHSRSSCALFDTNRSRRNLEAAYVTMWETWQRGEAPRSFAVAPG